MMTPILRWALPVVYAGVALGLANCAREPGLPAEDTRVPVNVTDLEPGMLCVDKCEPDYGSAPVDCAAAEAGLEFFPAPVWNLDGPMPMPMPKLYAYSDETTKFTATAPGACDPVVAYKDEDGNACAPYDLVPALTERCGLTTGAIHVRGGPYREWGAGIGLRLDNLAETAAGTLGSTCTFPLPADAPSFCPKPEARIDDAPGSTYTDGTPRDMDVASTKTAYYAMLVDLTDWEGISFWARRGPDSQGGFRVVIGDRQTDDDISFHESILGLPQKCRRYKECGCRDHKPCTPDPDLFILSCWEPGVDPPPGTLDSNDVPITYELCGVDKCDEAYSAYPNTADLEFYTPGHRPMEQAGTNTCSYYAFNTDQAGEYCYDTVNGPPPAEGKERCGDNWMDPVALNPDWTFYKIPFNELRQEGWAKQYSHFDQAGVTLVRFTWSVGWMDAWIDDVRFYRKAK